MNKIFELLNSLNWKQWVTIGILGGVAALCSLLLSSCGVMNRSSASGSRKVEKNVEQYQEWHIPARSTVYREGKVFFQRKEV